MSDTKQEVKQEPEVKKEEVKQDDTPQLSALEQEQFEAGWRPKDQWVAEGGDPDEWRSAREFKDRGELYKSIHSTKKELTQARQTISALQRHNKFIFEKAYTKAKNDLVKERRQALRDNDVERVDQIEEELEKLQTDHQETQAELDKVQVQTQPETTGVHPSFQAWLPTNRWYETNQELREYADFVGLKYSRENPGQAPEDVLRYVTQRVKQQFPDKFGSRKAAPSPTAQPSKKQGTSKGGTSNDEIEALGGNIEIMETLIKSGALTREKYVEDLKQINERKR